MATSRPRSPEPIDLPPGRTHGSAAGYRAGCGCPPCREAKRISAGHYRGKARAGQLALFDLTEDQMGGDGLLTGRKRLPHLPPALDLDALAAAIVTPEDRWWDRARCKGNAKLRDLFHEEVPVQIRQDGTIAYCAPGDFVPESYQAWCAACPVWNQCMADVMAHEPHQRRSGWWGSSPTQRRHIRDAIAAHFEAIATYAQEATPA